MDSLNLSIGNFMKDFIVIRMYEQTWEYVLWFDEVDFENLSAFYFILF
jgi:hypothetical protein